MSESQTYELIITTQGPAYPPSEVMDEHGNFIVIGWINRAGPESCVARDWSAALVGVDSPLPPLGQNAPYHIVRELGELSAADRSMTLHTLPMPLPCSNYPMVFAPDQCPDTSGIHRPSFAFHEVPIPDLRSDDGPKVIEPITLGQWVEARGQLEVVVTANGRAAEFRCEFSRLIPNSLYTVMSLREHDLDPTGPTRPGPLGVPNVFTTDEYGNAAYRATLPNPFPAADTNRSARTNRIVNIVVLWMSYQQSYGGAIGWFGLGGDIHAQLKLQTPSFFELTTIP
jgi:hypothetical protein